LRLTGPRAPPLLGVPFLKKVPPLLGFVPAVAVVETELGQPAAAVVAAVAAVVAVVAAKATVLSVMAPRAAEAVVRPRVKLRCIVDRRLVLRAMLRCMVSVRSRLACCWCRSRSSSAPVRPSHRQTTPSWYNKRGGHNCAIGWRYTSILAGSMCTPGLRLPGNACSAVMQPLIMQQRQFNGMAVWWFGSSVVRPPDWRTTLS
jgi:hypothetical protein